MADTHDAPSHLEILITCGTDDEASAIATALVETRAAACVKAMPIRSVYRWDGALQRDAEVLLLVTTAADRYDDVVAVATDLHSYEVPAVTAVPVVAGTVQYLDWVTAETRLAP
jgi:periplasmic divalent cation tolerance protein